LSDETLGPARIRSGQVGAHPAGRPPSSTATLVVVVTLVMASLIVFVIGLALAAGQAASTAAIAFSIAVGGSFLGWYVKALVSGSGRSTARINAWPPIGLVSASCFAVITGYGLFEMLTGTHLGTRIALFAAGIVGAGAALVAFVRDADAAEADGVRPSVRKQTLTDDTEHMPVVPGETRRPARARLMLLPDPEETVEGPAHAEPPAETGLAAHLESAAGAGAPMDDTGAARFPAARHAAPSYGTPREAPGEAPGFVVPPEWGASEPEAPPSRGARRGTAEAPPPWESELWGSSDEGEPPTRARRGV